VESTLLTSPFTPSIISSYTSPSLPASLFESLLEPLQKLVRLSPPIAASLAVPEIFTRTVQKLGHKDAVTRLNLLRILRTICDATEDGCWLIKRFAVYETIHHLSVQDPAILVRQMAEELVRACDTVSTQSSSRATGFRRPASKSNLRAGSGSSNGSGGTVGSASTPTSVKGMFNIPPMPPPPTSMKSGRDRISRSQSTGTSAIWDLQEEPMRVGINGKPPGLARASTAIAALDRPTSRPPSHAAQSSLTSRSAGAGAGSRPPSRDTTSASSSFSSLARLTNEKASSSSRLPKARQGRLSEAVSRRRQSQAGEENAIPGAGSNGANGGGREDMGVERNTPLPRLQIVRRRRETSGGEMGRRSTQGSGGG
jgi:hypothetical protein